MTSCVSWGCRYVWENTFVVVMLCYVVMTELFSITRLHLWAVPSLLKWWNHLCCVCYLRSEFFSVDKVWASILKVHSRISNTIIHLAFAILMGGKVSIRSSDTVSHCPPILKGEPWVKGLTGSAVWTHQLVSTKKKYTNPRGNKRVLRQIHAHRPAGSKQKEYFTYLCRYVV